MDKPSFTDFFSGLSTEELDKIYENSNHEVLDSLISSHAQGEIGSEQLAAELTTNLRRLILDVSAVMSTFLLKAYHQWLTEQFQLTPKQD